MNGLVSLFDPFGLGIGKNGQYKMVPFSFNDFSWSIDKMHIALYRFMKPIYAPRVKFHSFFLLLSSTIPESFLSIPVPSFC